VNGLLIPEPVSAEGHSIPLQALVMSMRWGDSNLFPYIIRTSPFLHKFGIGISSILEG
jgi:hypothetical protein